MKPKYDITKLKKALSYLVEWRDKETNQHRGICGLMRAAGLSSASWEGRLFSEMFEPKSFTSYWFGDPIDGRKDHLLIRYKKRVKAMKALIKEAERRNAKNE